LAYLRLRPTDTEREGGRADMGRAPCCDKANVKKGPWSPEEDAKLKAYIEHHGTGGNWIALPQKIGIYSSINTCQLNIVADQASQLRIYNDLTFQSYFRTQKCLGCFLLSLYVCGLGLKRCGKSCRLRWLNYLRPNIKHGGFSEEEDNIICSLYVSIGSR